MANSDPVVTVVPLVYKHALQSDGQQSWRYLDLDLPNITRQGPNLASIQLETLTEGRTAQHEWKVVLFYSLDGKLWSLPVDLVGAISANGDLVHNAFTDTTKFGLHIRLALAVRSASGSNLDSAIVSAVAFLRRVT